MPDRQQIAEALRKYERVDTAAESLDLGVRRMYRLMKRYGLTLKDVLGWPCVPESHEPSAPTPAAPSEAKPQQAAPPVKPERNILKLTPADFSGPCLGESNKSDSRPGSADELLDRYHKLGNR